MTPILTADDLLARLLYRDSLMLIVDKPSGLPVHAGPGRGPNLEQYLDALRFGLPRNPGLAHRLDRETSGCLLLGRHRKALAKLGKLFSQGLVEKIYWAVVEGAPPADEGRIDAPLAKRSTQARGWWMKVDPVEGQSAITDYRVLGRGDGLAWLEFRPRTGRTHQIRVHAAELGCPLLNDTVYGRNPGPPPDNAPRLHLHARAIVVPLYANRDPIRAQAPVPAHMVAAFAACGFDPAGEMTPDKICSPAVAQPRQGDYPLGKEIGGGG
ncbi:Uncharacterized RNA pseudouridine synthase ZMO0505 [uncultured Gammaproteobacteria bacterium]